MGTTGKLRVRGVGEWARDLRATLELVGSLGVAWRGTRFDHYAEALESMAREGATPGRVRDLYREALRQSDQLVEASALFSQIPRDVLVPKLKLVFSGPDLHLDSAKADKPRNALFELMTGRILMELGFRVSLTAETEDILATHAALTRPVSVECKRPAYCQTQDEVQDRMIKNLVKLRDQLKKRDPKNFRMGVVALDGLYRMRDHVAFGLDHEKISENTKASLQKAVNDIHLVNKGRALRLHNGIDVGAVVLLGLGEDAGAKGFALRFTRFFFPGWDAAIPAAFMPILDGQCVSRG